MEYFIKELEFGVGVLEGVLGFILRGCVFFEGFLIKSGVGSWSGGWLCIFLKGVFEKVTTFRKSCLRLILIFKVDF